MKAESNKYKCFFCGNIFTKKEIASHFNYGPDEFPVCINGKAILEKAKE